MRNIPRRKINSHKKLFFCVWCTFLKCVSSIDGIAQMHSYSWRTHHHFVPEGGLNTKQMAKVCATTNLSLAWPSRRWSSIEQRRMRGVWSMHRMHWHLKSFECHPKLWVVIFGLLWPFRVFPYFSPHLCLGFLFLVLYPARPPSSLRLRAVSFFRTPLFHTQLFHTHLSLSLTHTRNLSHNFVTHNFVTHTHNSFTRISLTHNFVKHTQLFHTDFSHTTLSHITRLFKFSILHHLLCVSCLLRTTSSTVSDYWKKLWLVGLSGPLIRSFLGGLCRMFHVVRLSGFAMAWALRPKKPRGSQERQRNPNQRKRRNCPRHFFSFASFFNSYRFYVL